MYIPFEKLPPLSRVWVYQADRSFSTEEEKIIFEVLTKFCSTWEAHGDPLKTSFKIEFNRFVILSVDESSAGASGCSIDGSVRVLKDLGNQCNINFFDRTKVAFLVNGEIETHSLNQLKSLFESAQLKPSMQTFNTLVATKGEWEANWKTTAEKSWLIKYLPKDALSV
jgi:hypothetical protein